MRNDKINKAWNSLCDAIDANQQALGSEQYTLLINLADTLANDGEEYTTEAALAHPTELQLMHKNHQDKKLQQRVDALLQLNQTTDQQLIAAQLKAWGTTV